jgi:hypothetical protein
MADRIMFESEGDVSMTDFYNRAFADLAAQNYVPVGKAFGGQTIDGESAFSVIYGPKDKVDAGIERSELIKLCYYLPVPSIMMGKIRMYEKNSGTVVPLTVPEKTETESFPALELRDDSTTLGDAMADAIVKFVDPEKPDIQGYVRRLTFISASTCMVCDKNYCGDGDPEVHMVTIAALSGWLLCDRCIEKGWAAEEVITALNKKQYLMLDFLFDERFRGKWLFRLGSTDYVMLKFWRRSQQATFVTAFTYGDLQGHTKPLPDNTGARVDNIIDIEFIDKPLSTDPEEAKSIVLTRELVDELFADDIGKNKFSRGVSLRNLFYYNPGLYEDLMETSNLFGDSSPLMIRLSDMSGDMIQMVESQKRDSDESDGKFHR